MIYIVRHGQTEKNKANLLQGRSDVPLNAAGRAEAETVRDRFAEEGISFDLVYTSPLLRAVETAEIIAGICAEEESSIITDERLIEMEYGPYEGMDLMHPAPEVLAFFKDFVNVPAPEGMEQLSDVVARAGDFLDSIRPLAEGKNILISTHAIAMKGLLEYLTPGSNGAYWSKYIGNCAVYAAENRPGGFGVPVEWDTERGNS